MILVDVLWLFLQYVEPLKGKKKKCPHLLTAHPKPPKSFFCTTPRNLFIASNVSKDITSLARGTEDSQQQ